MDITLSQVLVGLVFIVPGLVALGVNSLFRPSKSTDWKQDFTTVFLVSVINYVLVGFLVEQLIETEKFPDSFEGRIRLGLYAVVSPVALYFFYNLATNFLGHFGFALKSPKTAWDYFFLKREAVFVVVHLKDGRRIGGWYGKKSFASLYPIQGHIYLEEVWTLNDDGGFIDKVPNTYGILIDPAVYELVEFFYADIEVGEEKTNVFQRWWRKIFNREKWRLAKGAGEAAKRGHQPKT
tara:strand:+ start:253 stop:963 length:711 start_codon:yes stop_codon:yes gene_type:complete